MESTTESTTGSITKVCRSGQISDTIVAAVAEATGTDPLDLEPLYHVADPDALNALFQPSGRPPSASMEVSFSMAGCDVVVHGDGEVVVTSPTETDTVKRAIAPQDD